MKSKIFTVKDFITYNNPCFSCNNQINFKIGFIDTEEKSEVSYLRPTVGPDYTEIDLSITYSDSLKLLIIHKNNKIVTSNIRALTKYLGRRKLFLNSYCDRCYTRIESQNLDFNLDKGVVNAVSIRAERLMVVGDACVYQIDSIFSHNKSKVIVDRLDKSGIALISPTILDVPLLPKYKFKNKQHFIEKLKTYLLFS